MMEGVGTYTWANSGVHFDGQFAGNALRGNGRYEWDADGAVYDGGFARREGELSSALEIEPAGDGVLTTASGATLRGTFARGRLQGEGVGTYPAEREEYAGQYADGQRCG